MASMTGRQSDKDYSQSAAIANGANTSAAINLGGNELVGFFIPAAITGANLSILAAPIDGGTYSQVTDGDGADIVIPIAASRYVPIVNLPAMAGLQFIKVKSDANEGAARSIGLATRPI